MRKRLYAIWSVLLVLVVSIAVLVPGCGSGLCGVGVQVEATLCGSPWQGTVSYTLSGPGGTIAGTSVRGVWSVDCGSWTCAYVSGGPADAYLVDIAPNATQTLSGGGTITFTLNFELEQDASIEFKTWTISGQDVDSGEEETHPCDIIDVHYEQRVAGCPGYNVTVNETSWVSINQTGGPAPATVFVVNDWCALNKTPVPPHKWDQVPSSDGNPIAPGMNITLSLGIPVLLDVETSWQLVKCLNYTKSINWLGISKAPFVPGMEHDCVLFELSLPVAGNYTFTLVASAEIELVDDVDVNSQNNVAVSPSLNLTVTVPP